MNPELLALFQDPSRHEELAEMLAGLSAPPQLPDMMPQGQQPGAVDFGSMLAQAPQATVQGLPGTAPQPMNTMQQQQVQGGLPPSGGFNPNADRAWREDAQLLSDEEFQAKWGAPKPQGGQ